MKRTIKLLALIAVFAMVFSTMFACQTTTPATEAVEEPAAEAATEAPAAVEEPAATEPTTDLPRNETLYFAGQQWGAVNGWNPLSDDMNNAMCIASSAGGSRICMFETLYMYNMLEARSSRSRGRRRSGPTTDLGDVKLKPAAVERRYARHRAGRGLRSSPTSSTPTASAPATRLHRVDRAVDDATIIITPALTDDEAHQPAAGDVAPVRAYMMRRRGCRRRAATPGHHQSRTGRRRRVVRPVRKFYPTMKSRARAR